MVSATQQNDGMLKSPTFSVVGPNKFRKYKALCKRAIEQKKRFDDTILKAITHATIRWLSSMSFLETTAKYETLMKRYTVVTEIMPRGAARLIVRTGSRTSEST